MTLKTECFLAWRYFKPKRNAVSIITLISVIGVILGVAVLIVVLAVMTGFSLKLQEKLLATGAHAQISKDIVYNYNNPRGNARTFDADEADDISDIISKHGGKSMPMIIAPVLLQVREAFTPKVLGAFDPSNMVEDLDIKNAITRGKFSLERGEVAVSNIIAAEYGISVGDKILLHSPARLSRLIEKDEESGRYKISDKAEFYLPGEYTVTCMFSFDKYDFDKDILFMSLDDADTLFGLDFGASTKIYTWVDDPFNMDKFEKDMRKELAEHHPGVGIQTWKELNGHLLDVLEVEKRMQFFLLIFIILVAAFSITNTLITTVIRKTREIGLLKSMGAGSLTIMRVFIMQGLFVGVIGTTFGVIFGWLVVIFRMNILYALRYITGQDIFPADLYLFSELPAHIVWGDVAIISVVSVLLCTLGALVPAIRAANLDPAKALRYE